MEGLWQQFDRIVVFDTETTGIAFGKDRIIELGAVSLEAGAETGSLDVLVRLPEGGVLPPLYRGADRDYRCAAFVGGSGPGGGGGGLLPPAGGM